MEVNKCHGAINIHAVKKQINTWTSASRWIREAALRYCGLMNANFYVGCILPWFSGPAHRVRSWTYARFPLLWLQQMGRHHCFCRLAISSHSCCHFYGKEHRRGCSAFNAWVCGAPDWGGRLLFWWLIINNGPYEDYKIITSILTSECSTHGGH